MFEFKWTNSQEWSNENELAGMRSKLDRKDVVRTLRLQWEEHCLECAIPECYTSCVLYDARKDGACKRFVYGIYPNKKFVGHYNYGADIRFRKWGKIEANLECSYMVNTRTFLGRLWNINAIYKLFKNKKPKPSIISADTFDEFVIECHSTNETPFKLIFEYFEENSGFRKTKFRMDFTVYRGHNIFKVPFYLLKIDKLSGYIYLYPEDTNSEKRMVFLWLDFLKYKTDRILLNKGEQPTNHKVKCVVWDLDNTLWDGIFIEDEDVIPNVEAIRLMHWLDSKGIIQTIISKNDYDPSWEKIKNLNLDKFFVFPEINWEPKSRNLKKIVQKLNIGIESIAVIDDSHFERDEIKNQFPEVRVYSDRDITEISKYEEFDVIASKEGRNRRMQYILESKRNESKAIFGGSYEDFLIDCKMEMEAFIPTSKNQIDRCYELIQRSNQLNLSTIRYSKKEFGILLGNSSVLPIAFKCRDRYGAYGIIGFSTIRMDKKHPFLENLVISCRVAQKMVEHTFIDHLSLLLRKHGYSKILTKLILTAKNGPLVKVFKDIPFKLLEERTNMQILSLDLDEYRNVNNVIEFELNHNIALRLISHLPQSQEIKIFDR